MAIINLQRRLREAGRIRIGAQVATSRGGRRPAKIDAFRLTSRDERTMQAAASLYGGEVRPWEGSPSGDQFELYTERTSLDVVFPPVDLGFSQFYELWSGGGCQRRCDGERDLISDGVCLCDPDPELRECKPTTRLNVILADLEGIGVWRLESHGWNAAAELLATMDAVTSLQGRGSMIRARLLLEQRVQKKILRNGKAETRKFAVPVLDLNLSVAAIGSGADPATGEIRRGLTPIAAAPTATIGVGEQIGAVNEPELAAPRKNAAAPIPATRLAPRTAAEAGHGVAQAPPAKAAGARKSAGAVEPGARDASAAPAPADAKDEIDRLTLQQLYDRLVEEDLPIDGSGPIKRARLRKHLADKAAGTVPPAEEAPAVEHADITETDAFKKMMVQFKELGFGEREDQIHYIQVCTGTTFASRRDMSMDDVCKVIEGQIRDIEVESGMPDPALSEPPVDNEDEGPVDL